MKRYRVKIPYFLWFKQGDLVDETTEGFNESWIINLEEIVDIENPELDLTMKRLVLELGVQVLFILTTQT